MFTEVNLSVQAPRLGSTSLPTNAWCLSSGTNPERKSVQHFSRRLVPESGDPSLGKGTLFQMIVFIIRGLWAALCVVCNQLIINWSKETLERPFAGRITQSEQ